VAAGHSSGEQHRLQREELACELNVSPHAVHEQIKAIHRAFGARSRGELFARAAKANGQGLRTRLIAKDA